MSFHFSGNVKKIAVTIAGIAIIWTAVFAVSGWMQVRSEQQSIAPAFDTDGSEAPSFAVAAQLRAQNVPAGYKEYHNETFGLSLYYPDSLTVKDTDLGDGERAVSFQNIETAQGFQIFMLPYGNPQITQQRFHMDVPSGIKANPTYGTIAGADAAAFYSKDGRIGDTYEVWFIHDNHLFEITTLKPLDTWLQGILQTWKFI